MIRIANIITNDILNGEGICVSLWTQGCPHHCPGCHNQEQWDFNGGTPYKEDEILEHILQLIQKNGIQRNLSILRRRAPMS